MQTLIFLILLTAAAFMSTAAMLAAVGRRHRLPGKRFQRMKGVWSNGEYLLLVYFEPTMLAPRVRLIEWENKGENPSASSEYLTMEFHLDDYEMRLKSRYADFHNGRVFVRITHSRRKDELELMPGATFTRIKEMERYYLDQLCYGS